MAERIARALDVAVQEMDGAEPVPGGHLVDRPPRLLGDARGLLGQGQRRGKVSGLRPSDGATGDAGGNRGRPPGRAEEQFDRRRTTIRLHEFDGPREVP